MMYLFGDKQHDIMYAINITSRYLDGILNINNVCFDNLKSQVYPSAFQLNTALIPNACFWICICPFS